MESALRGGFGCDSKPFDGSFALFLLLQDSKVPAVKQSSIRFFFIFGALHFVIKGDSGHCFKNL
jgi:hypothetical protein